MLEMSDPRRSDRKRTQTQLTGATETERRPGGGTREERNQASRAREAAVASAYGPLDGVVQLGEVGGEAILLQRCTCMRTPSLGHHVHKPPRPPFLSSAAGAPPLRAPHPQAAAVPAPAGRDPHPRLPLVPAPAREQWTGARRAAGRHPACVPAMVLLAWRACCQGGRRCDPALVLPHCPKRRCARSRPQFWSNSERQHGEFAMYYGLPQLSVKACCHHLMADSESRCRSKRCRPSCWLRVRA
jgi:hypothetical protein